MNDAEPAWEELLVQSSLGAPHVMEIAAQVSDEDMQRLEERRRRPPVTPEDAAKEAREAGFEPEELYPGRANRRWKLRCVKCGQVRSSSLGQIRLRDLCNHFGSPLWVPPPSKVKARPAPPTPVERQALAAKAAEAAARAAGYDVLETPSGKARDPLKLRCITCGQLRRTSLSTIRAGKTCQHVLPEETGFGKK